VRGFGNPRHGRLGSLRYNCGLLERGFFGRGAGFSTCRIADFPIGGAHSARAVCFLPTLRGDINLPIVIRNWYDTRSSQIADLKFQRRGDYRVKFPQASHGGLKTAQSCSVPS